LIEIRSQGFGFITLKAKQTDTRTDKPDRKTPCRI